MKKYLFILAGLLCFLGQGYAEAKAYKLGRMNLTPCTGDNCTPNPCIGDGCGPTPVPCTKPHCNACVSGQNSCASCADGYYLYNGNCLTCPSHAVCRNNIIICDVGYYKNGNACASCSSISIATEACPNARCSVCQAYGSNVQCLDATCGSGCNKSVGPSGQATCLPTPIDFSEMQCVAGYRKVVSNNGKQACCVAMCSGVSCVDGYTPTPTEAGCCCMSTGISIPNCQTQNGNTCTKCNSGYYLLGNSCVTCPDNASCNGTNNVSCNSGYYKKYLPMNGTGRYVCLSCPEHSSCSGDSYTCNNGYYEDLIEDPYNGNYWGCKSCSTAIPGCLRCNDELTCTQCAKGYILSNGACAASAPVLHACDIGQVWHPVLKKCVTAVCWAYCADECQSQMNYGYCRSCISGYYMNSQGGCSPCSSVIGNCTRCASSFDDNGNLTSITCTKCNGLYHLENGQCMFGAPNIVTPLLGDENVSYQLN